jgi:UDP-N-acetylglucosamine diphosphorylase / glucose-1-phosphate thymidylyltransferase / UDP-N-acetylgalactosamine diphosphorylase / glucosamine-1-phosphate N-acetyltransferase / galactosamine-1-phosphate N-acetyltransferase
MQAVILAAGRGTRMKELTDTTPKSLLKINGKTLLQYKFESLPDEVDEIIIVVGYMADAVKESCGDSFKGKPIRYIPQDTLDGTAGALWRTKDFLRERFLVMMGDDLYSKEDIKAACKYIWSELVQIVEDTRGGGATIVDDEGNIVGVEEGVHEGKWMVGTNMFVLDTRLFDFPMIRKAPGSDEFGLPQTIVPAAKSLHIPFKAVHAKQWIQITSPEDLKKAEEALKEASI